MGETGLGLLVSAVGRRVVLGDRSRDELAAARGRAARGRGDHWVLRLRRVRGVRGRATELFNQTLLATVITESEDPLRHGRPRRR